MMKKNIVSLIIAGTMIALVGCGGAVADAPAPAEPVEEVEEEVQEEIPEEIEEEIDDEELEIQFDVEDAMNLVVKYYTLMNKPDGEYAIYDNDTVDNGDTIDFVVRYIMSEAEADEIVANGGTPEANIYFVTVTVDKATSEAEDENGTKFTLYGEDSVANMDGPAGDFAFSDVTDKGFVFCSGAGAWDTTIVINEDGTFAGKYHDSDMGDTGDDYPNGTYYYCYFDGKFTEPTRVDDYSYEVTMDTFNVHKPASDEEIKDGVKNIFSDPYGMEDYDKFVMYFPGTPIENIPEDVRSWLFIYDENATTIDEYVLANLKMGYGFIGSDGIYTEVTEE